MATTDHPGAAVVDPALHHSRPARSWAGARSTSSRSPSSARPSASRSGAGASSTTGPLTALKIGYAPLMGLFVGPWFLAGVVGGLVVRRPGAALFCEVVAALVSMLPGTEWGATVLVSGILQGLGAELAFAVFGYKAFGAAMAALAGVLSAPLEWAFEVVSFPASWADVPVLSVLAERRRLVRRVGAARQARLPRGDGRLGCRARRARRLAARAGAGPGRCAVGLPGRPGAPGVRTLSDARVVTGGTPTVPPVRPRARRVEVDGLTWRPFGRRDPVLRDVTLTLRPGSGCCSSGPRGRASPPCCGPSPACSRRPTPVSSTARCASTVSRRGSGPGAVGLVLQEPGAGVVAASVGRDVAFGPENVGMPRAAMPGVVASALACGRPRRPRRSTPRRRRCRAGRPSGSRSPARSRSTRRSCSSTSRPRCSTPAPRRRCATPSPRCRPGAAVALAGRLGSPPVAARRRSSSSSTSSARGSTSSTGSSCSPTTAGSSRTVRCARPWRAERDRLLAMGIWVPGEGPPEPVAVDPALVAPRRGRCRPAPRLRSRATAVRRRAHAPGSSTARPAPAAPPR